MLNKSSGPTNRAPYNARAPAGAARHPAESGKYRLNRYNWLGHKLIGLHQYNALDQLRRHLIRATAMPHEAMSPAPRKPNNKHEEGRTTKLVKNPTIEQDGRAPKFPISTHASSTTIPDQVISSQRKIISDHLIYLHCLTLMRTTSYHRLDETLLALQQLDLERNSQHFLLLCQCLLFSGNFDSVAALCKQMINKQIDILSCSTNQSAPETSPKSDLEAASLFESNPTPATTSKDSMNVYDKPDPINAISRSHPAFSHTNAEFYSLFKQVRHNQSINNPKLWCVFAKSLEYQRQFKDAQLSYQIASSLANFNVPEQREPNSTMRGCRADKLKACVRMSNYQFASLELAKFSIRHLNQYRHAELALSPSSWNPSIKNNQNDILLALTRSVMAPNVNSLASACDIIRSLENHYYSRENPSAIYNQLAQRTSWLKTNMEQHQYTGELSLESTIFNDCLPPDSLDPRHSKPDMTLAKSWLLLSQWTAQSEILGSEDNKRASSQSVSNEKQITELIQSIVDHNVSCYRSSGLWNNLGLLFLARRHQLASLSCLLKAHQIDPLNWRINFNLALVCHHIGLLTRANLLALTAKNLKDMSRYPRQNSKETSDAARLPMQSSPLNDSLVALCYHRLAN